MPVLHLSNLRAKVKARNDKSIQKISKKESPTEEVHLKELEKREIVKNSLLNVYKETSELWNQAKTSSHA